MQSKGSFPELIWRNFANVACVVAFMLMHAVLSPIPLFAGAVPMLLACIIGYSLMQETRISTVLLVMLGLIHDTVTGLPLGVTALQLLALKWGLMHYVDVIEDEGFATRYLWIILGLCACFLLQYLVVSFVMRTPMPLSGILLPLIVTVLLYPLVHLLLLVVQRRLYRRIWAFLPSEYKPVK